MSAMSDPVQALAMALGRVASGLYIMTARSGSAETGMLASWVQQCSFEPPQLSVAVRRDRDVLTWLGQDAPFTINILGEKQSNLLSHFGKGFALDQPAFNGLKVGQIDGEAPVLGDALGYLCCRVAGRISAGDHDLVIGTIVSGQLLQESDRPMIHVRKNGLRY